MKKGFKIYYKCNIAVLIFLLLIITNCKKKVSKPDNFYSSHIIINSFYQSNLEIIDFFETASNFYKNVKFDDEYSKMKWLDGMNAVYLGYKDEIKLVKLINKAGAYDALFILNSGKTFYYSNGKMLPQKKLKYSGLYKPYIYYYVDSFSDRNKRGYPYGSICYDFIKTVYGETKKDVEKNLVKVKFQNRSYYFNKKNNAAQNLQFVFNEIEEKLKNNEKIKEAINSIKHTSTYARRMIEYKNKLSFHSMGIAIDMVPYTKKQIYWFWGSKFYPKWWQLDDGAVHKYHDDFVKIFEKYGFCWGGKWIKYDTMHFEYTPEVLYQRFNF